MEKVIPEYLVEKVDFINIVGQRTTPAFYIFYNTTKNTSKYFFKRNIQPSKKYLTHRVYHFCGSSIANTDFKSLKIAKEAIANYLSKGIKLPTTISEIIEI